MHYTPQSFAVMLVGFALALTRLLTASKPFWSSTLLAKYLTTFGPALLVALAAVPGALSGAKSWVDVGVALLLVGGAGFTAAHGNKGGGDSGDGSAVGPSERMFPPDSRRPPGGMDAEMTSLQKRRRVQRLAYAFAMLALAFLLVSCAGWKPVAKTADGVAETLCAQFFGEKRGLSLEDAAKQFCSTREDLEPWIDSVLAAKRQAAPKAAALHP